MKWLFGLSAVLSWGLFAENLQPSNFREWLDDSAISADRPIEILVSVPLSQVDRLNAQILAADPKTELDSYRFRTQQLRLKTTKKGVLAIEKQASDLDVTLVDALSDLGTLDRSMGQIDEIREALRYGKISRAKAIEEVRAILKGEFNLKKQLSKNDILALGVALLEEQKVIPIPTPDIMLEKVRLGYAVGRHFGNEKTVPSDAAAPADTEAEVYIQVGSFPSAAGDVTTYRRVHKRADSMQYIYAAKLPVGYEYKFDPASDEADPHFILEKK